MEVSSNATVLYHKVMMNHKVKHCCFSVFPQAILLINSVIRKKETYQYFLTSIGKCILPL